VAFLRHKRDANARKTPSAAQVAAPVAVFVTLGAVGAGVLSQSPDVREVVSSSGSSVAQAQAASAEREEEFVSRSFSRKDLAEARDVAARVAERKATAKAIRQADTKLWTTAVLNIWDDSSEKAEKLGLIDERERVLVTGRRANDRAEIVLKGKARWVTAAYLQKDKPEPPEPEPVATDEADEESSESSAPAAGATCTNGSSVPSGVSPNVVKVHEAVCANFPELTSYGTFRSDGEHSQGIAIDIMVSGDRGWQVAEFVRANASSLGVSYAIYSQKIWSVERGGEGWRWMEDRGSTTANHYDHVHVTTY
jgi:hypothetical protein